MFASRLSPSRSNPCQSLQAIKFYEQKQYKKALKTLDAILKKYPNHGESLSMKGLVVRFMSDDRCVRIRPGSVRGCRRTLGTISFCRQAGRTRRMSLPARA